MKQEATVGIPHQSCARPDLRGEAQRRHGARDLGRRRRHRTRDARDLAPAQRGRHRRAPPRRPPQHLLRRLRRPGGVPPRGTVIPDAAGVRRWPDQTLLSISDYEGDGASKRPAASTLARSIRRSALGILHEPRTAAALHRAWSPASTVREMAVGVGVTERAVVAILNQLEDEGISCARSRGGGTPTASISAPCTPSRAGRPATGRCRRSSSMSLSWGWRRWRSAAAP